MIDLREPAEIVEMGRIAQGFDPARRTILHCASGARSALGAATLQDMGHTNVAHLDGGLKAWVAAGRHIQPAGR